ncbi:MAG: membrane protein insertion efficiency factor YidD [Deltaproteobacteria bacterium]|nr:membrane protein insertion efficiency factor YidD [Deltaproteobacteria bacterium]
MNLIRIYQVFLSPWMGGHCRFYPSCSEYAKEVFENESWCRAFWESFKRILRCHPFHSGGVDFPKLK